MVGRCKMYSSPRTRSSSCSAAPPTTRRTRTPICGNSLARVLAFSEVAAAQQQLKHHNQNVATRLGRARHGNRQGPESVQQAQTHTCSRPNLSRESNSECDEWRYHSGAIIAARLAPRDGSSNDGGATRLGRARPLEQRNGGDSARRGSGGVVEIRSKRRRHRE